MTTKYQRYPYNTDVQEHHQGGMHNLYLGNTTAEVRDEQHSYMLPRQ